ncbi:MAG: methyltransferase [Candidatus Entotheonellia bacterium]
MAIPTTYRFTRFLAAKKSVDDRALNRHVWQCLTQALPQAAADEPVQVLEIGAGIGTMVERLVEWGLLRQATYTAIDADPETIAESRRRLPAWMAEHGFSLREDTLARQGFWRNGHQIVVETEAIDLQRFVGHTQARRTWDLLIAHAVLDLLDIPTTLPSLLTLLRPGGLFYFTIVFDGDTILQPEIDPALDAQIEVLYHQTMDQRRIAGQPAGDSRTGRHLFPHLRAVGADILAAGSSDWIIFAGPHGYPDDEAYFLHFIIHTIGTALHGHPQLDPGRLAHWIAQRHAQIEQGTLVYIAHQLDFLGRVPPSAINP